jgi:hypothetical protein
LPFDGNQVSQELLVLRALVGYFDRADPWIQGWFRDNDGERACLVGALRIVRHRLGIRGDISRFYLSYAIRHLFFHDGRLMNFNDEFCPSLDALRDVVRLAYLRAGGDRKTLPPKPAPYDRSIHRFQAGGHC